MGKKWGWYQTLYHLADGKVLNIDAVTRISITAVLTFLSYEQDLRAQEQVNISE